MNKNCNLHLLLPDYFPSCSFFYLRAYCSETHFWTHLVVTTNFQVG